MSVVIINAISVPEGSGAELEKRFAARKHSVDQQPGFEGFQLLRPTAGESRYFVVTQWETQEHFEEWKNNRSKEMHARPEGAEGEANKSSEGRPSDQKPVGMSADLLEFEVVEL